MATDSNSPNDNEGRRRPPRPGKSVDPEKSLNMAESFEVFTDELKALNHTMRKMSEDIKASLDIEARYATSKKRQDDLNEARKSIADHPSDAGDVTMGVRRNYNQGGDSGAGFPGGRGGYAPGIPAGGRQALNAWTWQQQHQLMGTQPTGMSLGPSFDYFIDPSQRLTGTEGLQSMSHFQTWAAQAIGEKIAGHNRVYDPELLGGDWQGNDQMFERPGMSRFAQSRINKINKAKKARSKGKHREGRPVEQPQDQDTPVGVTDDESLAQGAQLRAQDTNVEDAELSRQEVQEVQDQQEETEQADTSAGQTDTEDVRESARESVRDAETPEESVADTQRDTRPAPEPKRDTQTTPPETQREVPEATTTETTSPRHAAPGPKHAKPDGGLHRSDPTNPNAGQTASGAGGEGGGGGNEPPASGTEGEEGGIGVPPGTVTAAGLAAGQGAKGEFLNTARTRIGSAVAQSGGTAMGLTAALRRMPVVGLGIESVQRGTEFYQDQREQGREYQTMVGGSTGEGWIDKRREDMYRWENYFKFNGERAREQFQTVTAAGYNDRGSSAGIMNESREGALKFMEESYTNVGMDTDESGRVLEAVAKNSHANLDEVTGALKRLSDTAGETGVNAQKAREGFVGLFETFTAMGVGSNATQGASMLSQTQLQYGRQFEDVNMSGAITPQAQIMVGAQTGMGYGEVQGMLRNDPMAYGQAMSGTYREMFMSIDPELAQAAEQVAQGKDLNNEQELNSAVEELIGPGAPFENHDLNTKSAAFSAMSGIQVNPEQYVIMMVQEMGGNGMAQAATEEQEAQDALKGGSSGDVARGGGSSAITNLQEQGDPGGAAGMNGYLFPESDTELQGASDEEAAEKLDQWYREGDEGDRGFGQLSEKDEYEAASALEMSEWGQEGRGFTESLGDSIMRDITRGQAAQDTYMTGATNQYFSKWTQEGKSDPFLESLLQNTQDHEGAKVKIPIAGGGERVVSLEEAVQHYGPQLASGEVEFMEGEGIEGKTTAEVAGMEGTGELTDAGDERTTNDALDEQGVGQSMEQWSRENPDRIREREEATGEGEGGGSNRTIIDLTPEAKRIFQVQSGESDPAAAEGVPQDNALGQQNQRGGIRLPR